MRMGIMGNREVGFDDIGHGATLVLLHGIMSDRSVFDPLASKLANDHRVITVDLRGHGQSTPGHDYELGGLADDVLALLSALEVRSASFIGWSMGGTVAMDIALRHPGVVDRLVLVGSTPCLVQRPDWESGIPQEAAAALAQRLREDWNAGAEEFATSVLGPAPKEIRENYLRIACGTPQDVTLACFDSIGGLDARPRLTSMPMPVAAIVGSEDRVCPVAASAYLAGALGGKQFVIPGVGHAPFLTGAAQFESYLRHCLSL